MTRPQAWGALDQGTEDAAAGGCPPDLETLRAGLRLMALHALGDAEAAEEVAQESLVRALEALRDGRLREPAKLPAFVRSVARHVIADLQRGRAPRHVPLTQDFPSGDPSPLHLVVTREERAVLQAALGSLSRADRELLRLSFFEGLSPAEVAALRGEPCPRVRKQKERALGKLRAAFIAVSGSRKGGELDHSVALDAVAGSTSGSAESL